MTARRYLKDEHELSVLKSFERFQRDHGNQLTIVGRPDPPDAIIDANGKRGWIEITDAFFSQEVAISITSYAADDVLHRPSSGGQVDDPDATTQCKIESVIRAKLANPSMQKLANNMGPGTLLVGLYGPFFDVGEAASKLSTAFKKEVAQQAMFNSIYLYEVGSSNGHDYKAIL